MNRLQSLLRVRPLHGIRRLATPADTETVEKIKDILENKIRPTIQEDGGDVEFVSYDNQVVRVKLQGACTSCPSATITLKSGIKNMLQYHVPQVEDVEQVFDDPTLDKDI